MTTHIVFPDLDPDGLPATLSPRILNGLLRDELGFRGAIVSDAMDMQAIADRWGIVEGSVRFIAAGGDLVEPLAHEREIHAALVAAVETGRIPAAQIAASARRVARLRAWVAAQAPADPAWLGAPEHRDWAAAIARDAVTLLRDRAGTLPLPRDARIAVIECYNQWFHRGATERPAISPLAEALRPRFPRAQGVMIDGGAPTDDDRAAARAAAATADLIILGTRAANRFPAQAAFVGAALGWGKPTVAVALVDPYDAIAYPAAPTALATYGADAAMLDALGAILAGEQPARGALPVTVG